MSSFECDGGEGLNTDTQGDRRWDQKLIFLSKLRHRKSKRKIKAKPGNMAQVKKRKPRKRELTRNMQCGEEAELGSLTTSGVNDNIKAKKKKIIIKKLAFLDGMHYAHCIACQSFRQG